MFIGRKQELKDLENLYKSNSFQFLIMYGRRRVGKTELLKQFSKDRNVIFYSALDKNSNLNDFSKEILDYFNEDNGLYFSSWKDAFLYISNNTDKRITLIIDEFPYIAKNEPEVKSILQHIIDHVWCNKNIFLILCGSSISFMVNDVMGNKSPLFGRATAIKEIFPMDYLESSEFVKNYSYIDKIKTYCIFGGIPYYLLKVNDKISIEENIINLFINSVSPLKEEPTTLLKAELRDPMIYNSILEAIAMNANKITEIADRTHINVTMLPSYINNLIEMRIIKRIICAGEKPTSKKTQYKISDNLFAFWYRFIFSKQTKIDLMDSKAFVDTIKEELNTYYGYIFEDICKQYIEHLGKNNKLPFIPSTLSKWWGNNKIRKTQDDIDILGIDKDNYMFCECKFKNEDFEINDFNQLIELSNIFNKAKNKYFYYIVKSSYTKSIIEESKKYNCKLLTLKDLYNI